MSFLHQPIELISWMEGKRVHWKPIPITVPEAFHDLQDGYQENNQSWGHSTNIFFFEIQIPWKLINWALQFFAYSMTNMLLLYVFCIKITGDRTPPPTPSTHLCPRLVMWYSTILDNVIKTWLYLSVLCNNISHYLGASLESALIYHTVHVT